MIDFHCHLDLYPNPESVIKEVIKKKIFVLSVTTTPSAFAITNKLSKQSQFIKTALGLHPQLAHERHFELPLFHDLIPEIHYIGEIGLDGDPIFKKYRPIQFKVFQSILHACVANGGRIMSIHSRLAASNVLSILENNQNAGIPILHWFSGSIFDLKKAINLNCWFSVGPPMLLSNKGREIIKLIPKEKILTETDGPFTTLNNHSLMPWDVNIAVKGLSTIWGISIEDVNNIIDSNSKNILNLLS
jgi:TatD DNase family protein